MTRKVLFWLGVFALVCFIFGGWFILTAYTYQAKGLLWACMVFSAFAAAITDILNRIFAEDKEDAVEAYSAPEGGVGR